MQDDFYLSRKGAPSRYLYDYGPKRIRVDNCSEIFYKQDGKYYDYKTGNFTAKYYCCENEDVPGCENLGWFQLFNFWLGILAAPTFFFLLYWILRFCYIGTIRFYDCVKTCCNKCYNAFCVCCKPQSIARNKNNATRYDTEIDREARTHRSNNGEQSYRRTHRDRTHQDRSHRDRTHRSNIATISGDSVIHEVIQESLVDRLPRSKATVDQCTGRGNYFFLKFIIKYIEDNLC